MQIVFYHEGILPVKKYGGTERIIVWLIQALTKLGVQCTLIAHKGSSVPEAKIIVRDPSLDWRQQIPQKADLVHLFHTTLEELPCPRIITIEGNGQPQETFHQNTVFISQNHAQRHGSQVYVYNGINFDEYPLSTQQRNGFAFLAKARWPVKNLSGARKAAAKANARIDICGGWGIPTRWKERFHGMVNNQDKIRLLSKTSALLFPVRWHEPFGIAMVEAMAVGTPVIGSCYGSLPEVIGSDRGFVAKNQKMLNDIAKEFKPLNPAKVRESACSIFNHHLMAEKYLHFYDIIVKGQVLHKNMPQTVSHQHPEELLEF